MKPVLGCLGVVVVAVLIAAIMTIATCVGGFNKLTGLSQSVDAKWAQVQNVYQRRADLIPNLVNTVAGAANFEKSTLVEVTNARASVGKVQINPNSAPTDPAQLRQFEAAQGGLSSALSRLLVVAEKYPDLKANSNFQALQAQLEGTENRISVERGRFNEAVQEYNTTARRFPLVIFAPAMGFLPKPYFSASAGSEVPPKVQFDFSSPAASPAK
ncbi:MAG: LemA family protein [Chthoniobacteraceae bacterium]|nr:LemA family protein [Chthoniobacteraceae bacterium]